MIPATITPDGVGHNLEVGALDVEAVTGTTSQQQQRDEVDHQPNATDDQHRTRGDLGLPADATDRLHCDVDRDPEHQQHGQPRCEHLSTVRTERSTSRAVRPRGDASRHQGRTQSDHIGRHVPRVGKQRQRTREQARDQLNDEVPRDQNERQLQSPPVSPTGASVTVPAAHRITSVEVA